MLAPEATRNYLITALSGTPAVIERLLAGAQPDYDFRQPDRFSLREVLAHLADWEPVWQERVKRLATEEEPFLASVDESALAVEHDYARSDPRAALARFLEGRVALVEQLRALPDDAWERTGEREFVGRLTLFQQVVMALGHDGYHLKQIAEYLS